MKVTVIGVGKVGLPLACHLADLGHDVIVFDKSKELLEKIRNKENPLPWEDGIHLGVQVAPSLATAVKIADAIFVVTPTPDLNSTLSAGPVIEVLAGLEQVLEKDVVVSVVSTLDPRDASTVCKDRPQMKVVYNPPLIRLGNVKQDLREAKILFLGRDGTDMAPAATIRACYEHENYKPKQILGDVKSIALAKLAINATLSMRGAWGNEIASMARGLGANVSTVFEALSAEPRIGGTSYMLPGPPPAGPCLPRDMDTWSSIPGSQLASSVQDIHRSHQAQLVQTALSYVAEKYKGKPTRVSIIGLGYKKGGPDISRAIGTDIANSLYTVVGRHIISEIKGYDPACAHIVKEKLPFIAMKSTAEEIADCDVAIICQDYPFIREVLKEKGTPTILVTFNGV